MGSGLRGCLGGLLKVFGLGGLGNGREVFLLLGSIQNILQDILLVSQFVFLIEAGELGIEFVSVTWIQRLLELDEEFFNHSWIVEVRLLVLRRGRVAFRVFFGFISHCLFIWL